MDAQLIDVMQGRESNYLLPFLWLVGEDRETLPFQVEQVFNSGARAFCIESRTHEQFCQDEWWADMDVILREARKRDMKVWLLDAKHFPTGYANGLIERKYPQLRKWHLCEEHVDVLGPQKDIAMIVPPMQGEDQLLSVYAYRRTGHDEDAEGQAIPLTNHVSGDFLYWDVPEGCYRIFYLYKTRKGTMETTVNHIHMIDADSVHALIEAVYEPHYEHYQAYFGNTFAGFFSDEPLFGNQCTKGFYECCLGMPELALPWSDELYERLSAAIGEDAAPRLAGLWYPMGIDYHKIRVAYMDVATQLYRTAFSLQLGTWCRAHGVAYTGHIIEDMNAHARLGCSAGHFFRSMDGQDIAGIDIVLHQVLPGFADYIHTATSEGGMVDPEFFHYVLGKLAASQAHIQPRMQGRALCEVFGAYGWALGVPMMKWLIDHMLVRGINHFVPHAFSPRYPDPESPPHFYADGNNPQFASFARLMKYTNQVSHLLCGARHIANAAILYHAEAEWSGGRYMLMQKPAKVLYDAHIDYDILPVDCLCEQASVRDGKLVVHQSAFDCLIIPYAQYLPDRLLTALDALIGQGLCMFFVDGYPDGWTLKATIVPLNQLADELLKRDYNDLAVQGNYPLLRLYHGVRGNDDYIMLFNESATEPVHTVLRTGMLKNYLQIDLLLDTMSRHETADGDIPVHLVPYQSTILYFGLELPDVNQRELVVGAQERLDATFDIDIVAAKQYPAYRPYRTNSELFNITGRQGMPEFSGMIRYTAAFFTENPEKIIGLDLGIVGQTAQTALNGVPLGRRICPPYRYDIRGITRPGRNTLVVEVENTLANTHKDYFSRHIQIPPSGLLGPVMLLLD